MAQKGTVTLADLEVGGLSAVDPEYKRLLTQEQKAAQELAKAADRHARAAEESENARQHLAEQRAWKLIGESHDAKGAEKAAERADGALRDAERDLDGLHRALEVVRQKLKDRRTRAEEEAVKLLRREHEAVVSELDKALGEVSRLAEAEAHVVGVGSKALSTGTPGGPSRVTRWLRPLHVPKDIGHVSDRYSGINAWRKEARTHGYNVTPEVKR